MIPSIESKGDRSVALRFDQFPTEIYGELRAVVEQDITRLHAAVVGAVPRRRGELASQVQQFLDEKPDRIIGRVKVVGRPGTADFGKAAALEYGAHGTARLRAHAMRLDHIFGHFVAPFEVMVEAHDRRVDIAEHAYLRGPLDAMAGEFLADLQRAADTAVAASE